MSVPLFHLAFPVLDIESTRAFYVEVMGCTVGREAEKWIDFDFRGHQISAHLRPANDPERAGVRFFNPVDGHDVPIPHFGLILPWDEWHALADRFRAAGMTFVIEPYIRFAGQVGEQATMFILDPSGNGIEFKSFQDPSQVFAR